MTLKPMSDERHAQLIKSAERVIELMNVGVAPNAALRKVASDEMLSSHEVQLVSHAVNNSKTLSHLADSKGEDKGKPFPLTNAELVNQQILDADPVADAEAGDLRKQAAARASCADDGCYLDLGVEEPDHLAAARAAFGDAAGALPQAKLASVAIDPATLTLTLERGEGVYRKLASVQRAIDEARTRHTQAHDEAAAELAKIAGAFRLVDAPRWSDVERAATAMGAGETVLGLVRGIVAPDAAPLGKVAGAVEVSPRNAKLAEAVLRLETAIDAAAAAGAVHERLGAEYARIEKLADAASTVTHMADQVAELPDKLTGAAYAGDNKTVSLLNSAIGNSGEGPEYPAGDKSPLGVGTRQGLANAEGRMAVEKLLADPYVGKHPIQDVVAAYNRAMATNPRMGHAELIQLLRQDLAGDGAPLDTLLRVEKSHSPAGGGE